MSNQNNDFSRDTNYVQESGVTRIKYGVNRPILETELNEMQVIQENKAARLVRQQTPTGFLELKKRDFTGDPIIYNPNGLDNSIAIAPFVLLANGYELIAEGTTTINGVSGYITIDFGDAPIVTRDYYDFAFVEFWFEEVNSQSALYNGGFLGGNAVANYLVDNRVGAETARRVVLRHRISTARDVKFDLWPEGFGYIDDRTFSTVFASAGKTDSVKISNYAFASAANDMYRGQEFYRDYGLYVAGRPTNNTTQQDFNIMSDYIFAVPLFGVKRRNQSAFSESNPNGSLAYANLTSASDRPDGYFYNKIVERDIIDLRKTITFNGPVNVQKLLNQGLKDVMTGTCIAKSNSVMTRAQFGVLPIDVNSDSGIIFHDGFYGEKLTADSVGDPLMVVGTPKFYPCISGSGLMLDGATKVRYDISTLNKSNGTIEFFIRPFWDGADQNISQTIFTIEDAMENGRILLSLKKDKNHLVVKQSIDLTTFYDTIVDMNTTEIYNNEIYHVRIKWSSAVGGSYLNVYINGQQVAQGDCLLQSSTFTPHYLNFGEIETVNNYGIDRIGCVLDEITVYKYTKTDVFTGIDDDIANGYARLYPSFNGIFNGFQDNAHQQQIITYTASSAGAISITFTPPYGMNIDLSTFKVFSPTSYYEMYGTATSDNSGNIVFTLESPQTFNGEIVWVMYTVNIDGGSGIREIPTRLLQATINGEDVSFASVLEPQRKVPLVNADGTLEQNHVAYDFNISNRNQHDGFARTIDYVIPSNGTNVYTVPKTLYGRDVIGIRWVEKQITSISKDLNGNYIIQLVDHLPYQVTFIVKVALGGFAFEYSTYTKSLVSNICKASTITLSATGDGTTYNITANQALNSSAGAITNGGIFLSSLGFYNYYDTADSTTAKPQDVAFVDGQMVGATITGIGTPFIKVEFDIIPALNKTIEIPVLVSCQPTYEQILSVWYEYIPYQGILNGDQMNVSRISDWKVFCTTLGSGKVVANNLSESSISNATNRLPGGLNYAYLLQGDDITFNSSSMSDLNTASPNRKLVFRNDYVDLITNGELDNYFNVLDTDFALKKIYGKNHQDAFLDLTIENMGFYIEDTISSIVKYLGAACLVTDDEGNILLLVIGEIKKDPIKQSLIQPIHGDLFKLKGNPIVVARGY